MGMDERVLSKRIHEAIGVEAREVTSLAGGCIAEVYAVTASDGRRVVVKVDDGGRLEAEVYMLRELRRLSALPVPEVFHAERSMLVMERLPGRAGETSGDAMAQRHMGELLAALHAVRSDAFGYERDTLIGPLVQPNPRSESWCEFFAQHRLMPFARLARGSGGVSAGTLSQVETLASRIDAYITEPEHPSLLHGDLWSGNVLCENGRVSGVIDPAISFGHPEIELAFMSLFGCFGRAFYEAYSGHRAIEAGFVERRIHVYQLYPLLVHAHLFGGSYGSRVDSTLSVLMRDIEPD